MHPNAELIHTFYTCFANRDGAGMAACYHPNIVFSDPVFTHLAGPQAGAMWQMLCARGHDLAVRHTNVEANDTHGSAHWEATYTFRTGRLVHNVIEATFDFQDGAIMRHTDAFDLWKWAGMALGTKGKLLGWTPFVQSAIRNQAMHGLDAWMQKMQKAD